MKNQKDNLPSVFERLAQVGPTPAAQGAAALTFAQMEERGRAMISARQRGETNFPLVKRTVKK